MQKETQTKVTRGYAVVEASSPQELMEKVSAMQGQGWEIAGGVCVNGDATLVGLNGRRFYQTLFVRIEEEVEMGEGGGPRGLIT